ncbi:MAG: ATP-binding domain-containing protein [Thiolinea sp.]
MQRWLPGHATGHWFAGRPVMETANDYRQGLFNGDIGIALPDRQGQLRVWFADSAGTFRAFASVRLPVHETAWAMTIHKSQGSEFERVLLLLPEDENAQILGRELLYTGITRARSQLDIMGRLRYCVQLCTRRWLPPPASAGACRPPVSHPANS